MPPKYAPTALPRLNPTCARDAPSISPPSRAAEQKHLLRGGNAEQAGRADEHEAESGGRAVPREENQDQANAMTPCMVPAMAAGLKRTESLPLRALPATMPSPARAMTAVMCAGGMRVMPVMKGLT